MEGLDFTALPIIAEYFDVKDFDCFMSRLLAIKERQRKLKDVK